MLVSCVRQAVVLESVITTKYYLSRLASVSLWRIGHFIEVVVKTGLTVFESEFKYMKNILHRVSKCC